jgi:hypothetical protein
MHTKEGAWLNGRFMATFHKGIIISRGTELSVKSYFSGRKSSPSLGRLGFQQIFLSYLFQTNISLS